DDRSPPPGGAPDDVQPPPRRAGAAPDSQSLCDGAEGPARRVEGPAGAGETGQRPESDRERGIGDRAEGVAGPFAARAINGRPAGAVPRRGAGIPSPSHTARVTSDRSRLG